MKILSQQLARPLPPPVREARLHAVREGVLRRSEHITGGNFGRIATADLAVLLQLYDREFFAERLQHLTADRLGLRLSARLTSAAGKTYQQFRRTRSGRRGETSRFEIAVSTHLLFHNFGPGGASPLVNGLRCRDRLEALQRIFEHELVHLAELLLFERSSCRSARFLGLAQRLFGHRDVTHQLRTVRETARIEYGVTVGDAVRFSFRGQRHTGLLNRITKRATVLVPHPQGRPYSDGNRYRKFYVPPETLRPA